MAAMVFGVEFIVLSGMEVTDFTGMLVLNTAVILLLIFRFGYTAGAAMLLFSGYLLLSWSLSAAYSPLAYWIAGLAWFLPFTYIYKQRDVVRTKRVEHIFARERYDEEANEIEYRAREMEDRLVNTRQWRDRIAPLCNLAEDLLTALHQDEVVVSLTNNLPELIPHMENFYCYRTEGVHEGEAALLLSLPEGDTKKVYRLDELDRTCYQEGRPILIEDMEHAGSRAGKPQMTGSVVIAPLLVRTQADMSSSGVRHTIGAMRVENRKARLLDRSDLDVLNIISDVTARSLLNTDLYRETEHLAVRDALTGLLLRHIFFERATQALSRAKRSGASVSLVMFDIDDFKRLNDTWGHAAGDLVLKKLAEILQEGLNPGELVCRYGGEEMAILVQNDVLRATRRVKRLLANFAEHAFAFPGESGNIEEVHVTLSGGIAAYPLHAEELTGLIQQADRALYRAKKLGKKQVVTARRR